jgi:CRP-like cAMP-binding protein
MESFKTIIEFLAKYSSYNKEEIELVSSCFEEVHLKAEETLIRNGEKYSKIVFVLKGILRVFIIDDNSGEEIIKNFVAENEFVADMDSFENGKPTNINVSAVTDCIIYTLSKSASEKLKKEIANFDFSIKSSALQATSKMISDQNFLRVGDSVDQYRHFVKHFPHLAQHVPLKYIASYLRITQSSLSRIRRQID